jgi:DNA-binding helix-hairpin-helix protein with protein kinase domain
MATRLVRQARDERSRRSAEEAVIRIAEQRKAEERFEEELRQFETTIAEIELNHKKAVDAANVAHQEVIARLQQRVARDAAEYSIKKREYDRQWEGYRLAVTAWNQEYRRRKIVVESSRKIFEAEILRRDRFVDEYKQHRDNIRTKTIELMGLRDRILQADSVLASDIRGLESLRREIQLRDYLDTFLLRDANIQGIGRAKLGALLAYGVETAADMSYTLRVPGIGPIFKSRLIAWRKACEMGFKLDPRAPLPATELRSTQLKWAKVRNPALIQFRQVGKAILVSEKGMISKCTEIDGNIGTFAQAMAQAKVDLDAMEIIKD